MRISDTTLVVSAIFHVAEKNGPQQVTPGQVTSELIEDFGVTLPLHQINEIITDLGIVTHTVGQARYLVWNDSRMENIRETYIGKRNN